MSHDDDAEQISLSQLRDSGVLPGQIYKHYKGDEYLVTAVGLNEADLEPLVHYRRADDPYAIVWTRTLAVFMGRTLDGETLVTRYVQIS